MPKASPLQPSFSGGEFSPRVFGRTDSERYSTGAAICLNYLPTIEGPVVRRPGFKYSGADAKDPSTPPVLVPFPVSGETPFVLEIGDGYTRFFRDGGQVVTINSSTQRSVADCRALAFDISGLANFDNAAFKGPSNQYALNNNIPATSGTTVAIGAPLEMVSPFNSSDIRNLTYSYDGNTMYFHCGRLATYKLVYSNAYKWEYVPHFPLTDGPYLPFNTLNETGDKFNVGIRPLVVGTSILNKTAQSYLEPTPKVVVTGVNFTVNSTYIIANLSSATAHNFFIGQTVWTDQSQGWPGTGPAFGARRWTVTAIVANNHFTIRTEYTFGTYTNGTASASSFIYPLLLEDDTANRHLSMSVGGKRYWGIASVNSSLPWYIFFSAYGTALPNNNDVSTWQIGPFYNNTFNGYFPKYGCFHQNRLILAGAESRPGDIYGSVVGEFENFQSSNSSYVVSDNNALNFKLSSREAAYIRWVESDSNGLLAGGQSSEFKIAPSSQATALTPTNINASETSYFGSEGIPAVKAGNAVLYVQRSGRKIRELNYFFQFNSYKSTDLNQLSEHLTSPRIVRLANQTETIPAVWGLRSDGQLVSMVYGRDDETLKAGWARHELGGQSDSGGSPPEVKSMCVVSGSAAQYDSLWVATKRFINGTSVLSIEYSTKPFQADTKPEDAFFLDLGATYDSPKAITGITNGSALITCPSHGFSDGDSVQITEVIGLNTSVFDINGVEFNSNLVNYGVFRAASTAANTFYLTDPNNGSSFIVTLGYSAYTGGGYARKLVSTISGLTWLKNETVGVLADGKAHPDTVVNSGGILALSFPAAKVQVGLKYNSDLKTLRLDAGGGDGTSIGKIRRAARVAMQLYNVGEISVGMAFDKLIPMSDVEQFKADLSKADMATPLFSGIARDSLESSHDFDGQICIRQSQPMPGMIQSITTMLEENDV